MTTPLRRQYLDIKRHYPHAILFFRLGDFYETFDEDAEIVARDLEIVLTSRPVGKNERVPLAGIPHHALDSYLAKLIAKGHKVAICEQMEEPGKGRKIVERQVVRVVTPGTLVEDNLLDRGTNNYLAAVLSIEENAGLAYVDVSTGEFACLQTDAASLTAELDRLQPAEILIPHGSSRPDAVPGSVTTLPESSFNEDITVEIVLSHFGTSELDGLGLKGYTLATRAAGALLDYLKDTQPAVLGHISRVRRLNTGRHMALDANTRRNLELFTSLRHDSDALSLVSVLDHTRTPMGARLLRSWVGQPLLDITAINKRQESIQFFVDSSVRRGRFSAILRQVPDLERAIARISTAASGSMASTIPRDLVALRRGLDAAPTLGQMLSEDSAPIEMTSSLHPCAETSALIAAAIADDPQQEGKIIRAGFSDELDALRELASDTRQYVADLERRERERSGIKSLKVGYNRVFGYYIEVSKANVAQAPEEYQRKQTLVGAERYTTPELQDLEYRVLHAREQFEELEGRLLKQVCAQVAAEAARILETASAIALIDVYCSLAEAASRYGYVRPVVDESDELFVRDGRHPTVERMLTEGTFVPNDLALSSTDAQVILLTGPNMAGKSTYLRQAALIVLLAQTGSFVPAAEARIGVVDRIHSRVGALDDIAQGHSTFMVEMLETATILHSATPRSLLIFDEIGRGTSTYDGMAIARAVVEFVHNRPDAAARTLFATHYHELTELASTLPRVRNYNVAVAEEKGDVVFLHRILPGGADRSYGVHVAQLAGLPRQVVLRAQEILNELEAEPTAHRRRPTEGTPQLSLFQQDNNRLLDELRTLDVDSLTPLQAITRLYELVEKARKTAEPPATS